MNILIDTTPLQNAHSVRGIGRYTRELVSSLRELTTKHHFFTSEDNLEKIDIVHYPFFDFFFPTLPLIKNVKTIVTIHDVIPLLFSKHYPKGIKGTLVFWRQQLSLHNVSHIITDSQVSKRDITEKLHIVSDKISVVALAGSSEITKTSQTSIDKVHKEYSIPKKYLLYVGDINYSKNIPFLLAVIAKMPQITLVMVGSQLKNTSIKEGQEIERVIKEKSLEKRVIRITNLGVYSSTELSALYSGAVAYIQPSLYEGFGLPVIEAMRCRTPVISSLGGSLPEVVGSAAVFFHPHSEEECKAAIQKIYRQTASQRQEMIRKGVEQSDKFSWESTARETLAIYEKI